MEWDIDVNVYTAYNIMNIFQYSREIFIFYIILEKFNLKYNREKKNEKYK